MSKARLKNQLPKSRNVTVAVVFIVIVIGTLLQLNWMQKEKAKGIAEIPTDGIAGKLSKWMMDQKGVGEGGTFAAGGIEIIQCEYCFGTGATRSPAGKREPCAICLGIGSKQIRRFDEKDELCPPCAGMGRLLMPDSGTPGLCPRCEGRGLIRRPDSDEPQE